MDTTSSSSPVQAIQELIAVHSTRIEFTEKLSVKDLPADTKSRLAGMKTQSQQMTTELMNELSNFGDAVTGSVDHSNLYQSKYKETLSNIDELDAGETKKLIDSFEDIMRTTYRQYAGSTSNDFEAVTAVLSRHLSQLD